MNKDQFAEVIDAIVKTLNGVKVTYFDNRAEVSIPQSEDLEAVKFTLGKMGLTFSEENNTLTVQFSEEKRTLKLLYRGSKHSLGAVSIGAPTQKTGLGTYTTCWEITDIPENVTDTEVLKKFKATTTYHTDRIDLYTIPYSRFSEGQFILPSAGEMFDYIQRAKKFKNRTETVAWIAKELECGERSVWRWIEAIDKKSLTALMGLV